METPVGLTYFRTFGATLLSPCAQAAQSVPLKHDLPVFPSRTGLFVRISRQIPRRHFKVVYGARLTLSIELLWSARRCRPAQCDRSDTIDAFESCGGERVGTFVR